MNTFSATSPPMDTPKSILLIGAPGSGKTTLALQFPFVGAIDVDRNLEGPAKRLLALNPSLSFKYAAAYKDDKGAYVQAADVWPNVERVTKEILMDPEVKTVVYDGLTMSDDVLLEHVLKQQNTQDMQQQHWVTFRKLMIRIILACRSVQKTFVMICHEEPVIKTVKDAQGRSTEVIDKYVPSFRSKISNYFGGFFTDMWRCYTLPCSKDAAHPQGVKFNLETIPTALRELKNSCSAAGMPGAIDDITYAKLEPYLK